MKHVFTAIFGINVLLGNVCLMGTVEAHDMPMSSMASMHEEMHADSHCHHAATSVEEDCVAHHIHEAATLVSSSSAIGSSHVSVFPSPLITQALLVIGSVSNTIPVEYPPPLTSHSTVVLNQ